MKAKWSNQVEFPLCPSVSLDRNLIETYSFDKKTQLGVLAWGAAHDNPGSLASQEKYFYKFQFCKFDTRSVKNLESSVSTYNTVFIIYAQNK